MSRRTCVPLILILTAMFQGCSTLTMRQCESANWRKIGYVDASRGRPVTFFENHQSACEELSDAGEYREGWKSGLLEYCTGANAFHLSANGWAKPASCPQERQAEIDSKYEEGRKVWELRQAMRELEDHQAKMAVQEEKERQNEPGWVKVLKILSGPGYQEFSYSSYLAARRDQMREELVRLEATHPEPQWALPPTIESARPGVGALVGTAGGFGLGHAVQGRYLESGWVFSVGQVGSLGLSTVIGPFALIPFLAIKVWESTDLWNHSYQSGLGYFEP